MLRRRGPFPVVAEPSSRGNATVGTAYSAGGIAFTLAAGDKWTLATVDSIGNFIACVKTATDGSQTPCAILTDAANATYGPVTTGAYVMGEFNVNAITFDPSWTPELLTTALRLYGIFVKGSVSALDPGNLVQGVV